MFKRFAALILVVVTTGVIGFGGVVEAQSCGTHTVATGENLFRISLRYGVSMSALAAANNITNYSLIYVGQVLTIPCGGQSGQTQTNTSGSSSSQSNTGTGGLNCEGFRATSPVDGLPLEDIPFYWDPPASADQIARYQLHIFNEAGFEVAAQEILNYGRTYIVQNTSVGYIGPGLKFYWYVVGVTADNRICQTQTVWVPREWPVYPSSKPDTPTPQATVEVIPQ